jgi:hypothetical protein
MVSSGPRNVKGSNIILAAAAVITLLFLPLTASTDHNGLLQSQSAFAQQQEEGGGPLGNLGAQIGEIFGGGGIQQGGVANQSDDTGGPPGNISGGGQQQGGEQQQEETSFLPYLNPIQGIFMQYPSNWIASTSGLEDYTDLVAFYSPLQNLSDSFPARLTISLVNYGQNISLPEYTNLILTRLNQSEQVHVRSSSEVTIAGYPGHRVVLAIQPFQNSTLIFNQMNTWTTIGNKVYQLRYEGEESTFNQHLPEVSQMLETLRIASNNTNNMTTTTSGENQTQ